MDNNQKVAKFICETRLADIPQDAQEKTKLAFLDALGAAMSGTLVDVTKISNKFVHRCFPGDQATLVLGGGRSSVMGAAFANANAANAFDTDDDNPMVKGHMGAQLIPAAFAVAESQGSSGEELLISIATAYEVGFRAGRCWHENHDIWHGCGAWGAIQNAAACARLLGLSETQTAHALGIADYHAPMTPMLRDLAHPAMVKHSIGWAAATGVSAVELAALGYTGIPSIIGFEEYDHFVRDIGEVWHIGPVLGFKEIPGIAYGHLLIYALRQLREKHTIEPGEVESVVVDTFYDAWILPKHKPKTTEEAQFNVVWPLACELYFGKYNPLHQLEETLQNSDVGDLLERIEVKENPKFTELYKQIDNGDPRGSFVSAAKIMMKNGIAHTESCELKSFGHMLNAQQMADKFRDLTRLVMPDNKIDEIINTVMRLEKLSNTDDLTALIQ